MSNEWTFAEPDLASIMDQHASPLDALADGVIPAIVLRQVFHPDSCQRLIDRLVEQQLLYDPRQPISAQFQEAAIPEGYYREGNKAGPSYAWEEKKESGRTRIDV
ncbi:MAG: hypothetical protein VB878_18465, partial [Pirellulaceae bacterium]